MEAWDAVDVDGIAGLLAREAMMAMPPEPFYVSGREAVAGFFATVPLGGRLDRIRLVPTAANRQPALAAYAWDSDSRAHHAYGIMVFALAGDAVAGIVGFADPSNFERFGLPSRLEG
jgi:RNA polymerase sigma-70 factor (ECF subfamily)